MIRITFALLLKMNENKTIINIFAFDQIKLNQFLSKILHQILIKWFR